MTEVEKLDAGLPYDFYDKDANARKLNAIAGCKKLKNLQDKDASYEEKEAFLKDFFGSVGRGPTVLPGFMCDNGKNIHVGDEFLANYYLSS